MRLLADENFPKAGIQALREAGLEVLSIAEINPGVHDEEVLSLSVSTNRTLLTFDKDFGELAYRVGRSSQAGIILFRLMDETPASLAFLLLLAIQSQPSWAGHFSVVTRQKIRMRALPE